MSCDCCLDDEDQYEENINTKEIDRVYSYRNLSRIDQSYGRNRLDSQHPKISLRRRVGFGGQPGWAVQEKIGSIRTVDTGGGRNVVNFNQPYRNQNVYQLNKPKVFFTASHPPFNGPAPLSNLNHQQIKYISKPQPETARTIHTPQPQPPNPRPHPLQFHQQIPQLQLKPLSIPPKPSKPQVKIMYQQTPIINKSINTQIQTVIKSFNTAAQIQPIMVSLQSIPSPTCQDRENTWHKTKVNKELRQPRKSSIELDRDMEMERGEEFRGNYRELQLRKISSLVEGFHLYEERFQSSNLVRSTRINGQHIEDIECKNTQSVADCDSSLEQQSEVIVEHSDFPELRRNRQQKMTHSQTKFQKQPQKNPSEHKRSIIWQSSRKQSFFQL